MPIVLKGKNNNIELQVPGCSGGEGAVTSVNGQTGVVVLDIPSKVSELENDAGYLTEHQSLDALATKEALNDGLAAKQDKLTAGTGIKIENNTISITILEIIYPVGSLYLSTNETCPLSNFFGTWELVISNYNIQDTNVNIFRRNT